MLWWHMLILSLAAPIAEAIGGSYDNLLLAAVVIGGYYLLEGTGTSSSSATSLMENLNTQKGSAIALVVCLILGAASLLFATMSRVAAVTSVAEESPALYNGLLH
mmetsp:Transcript_78863/g.144300  ORF Transcript_78863/g.144300 Transcript_78863/m.144300 type:complete len:105 (-) Transcript_78863:72-386(-)